MGCKSSTTSTGVAVPLPHCTLFFFFFSFFPLAVAVRKWSWKKKQTNMSGNVKLETPSNFKAGMFGGTLDSKGKEKHTVSWTNSRLFANTVSLPLDIRVTQQTCKLI